jgi:hypothetical protein
LGGHVCLWDDYTPFGYLVKAILCILWGQLAPFGYCPKAILLKLEGRYFSS